MKRTLNIICAAIVCFSATNCSKNNINDGVAVDDTPIVAVLENVKTYGGSNNESAQAIKVTKDGGYIVLGYTLSNDQDIKDKETEDADFFLLKFNKSNVMQWSKTYGGSGDDRGFDLIENPDGSLVVLGYSTSNDGDVSANQGDKDYWVLKLSSTGALIWEKTFGFAGEDLGISIVRSNEGGYLLAGELDFVGSDGQGDTAKSYSSIHAGGKYWAVKINEEGVLQWSKQFGGSFSQTPKDIVQTQDGGYILVGETDSSDIDITDNKGFYDFWVVKISNTGILEWQKSFGGSNIDKSTSIAKTNDGNYLIVGSSESNDLDVSANKGRSDIWLVKISPSGELISEKSIGGTQFDTAEKINNASDGGYIIAGASRSEDGDLSVNQGQVDGWVVKMNSNLDIVWQLSTGGSKFDYIYDVAELSDGSVIAVGDTFSNDGAISVNKGSRDLLTMEIKQP